MAEAHVYVKVQVKASNADVEAIEQAAADLREAVESAGGEWRGNVTVSRDAEPEPPSPVASEASEEAHEDSVPADGGERAAGVSVSGRASHRSPRAVPASTAAPRRKAR